MHLNDLKIFQAVAELNSFTKAAAATHTVQSNVTARIKYLETYFGTTLLVRNSRSMELTPAGCQVLKTAKAVQLMLEQTKKALGSDTTPKSVLKIGCIHTTAAMRAPRLLGAFRDQYAQMTFRLTTGTSAALTKAVLDCKLDGAFVAGHVRNTALAAQPVATETLCLTASALVPGLAALKHSSRPLKLVVFSDGCSYRKRFEALLRDWNVTRYSIVEMDTLEGIINSVEAGIGVTLLPAALITEHYAYRLLKTFPLPKKHAQVNTVFIHRKDYPVSKEYQLFFDMLEAAYDEQVAI